MFPNEHVTVVEPEHVPCEGVDEMNVTPIGRVSVMVTFVQLSGPLMLV